MNGFERFAASALFALGVVPAAHAGDEFYLRWDNCFGDGGTYNKVFACDTNAGNETLVGSFRLAQTTTVVTGLQITVPLSALGAVNMPAWWHYQTGGCRQSLLSVSFAPPVTSTTCVDPWSPRGAVGGLFYDYPYQGDPREAHLRIQVAVPAGSEFTVSAGQEHFAFRVRIDHARTVGTPTCTGCSTPVCIAWGEALVTRVPGAPGGNLHFVGAATPDHGSNVTWQPGAVAKTEAYCPPLRYCSIWVSCESVTPAHSSTWGSIKTLYR